MKITRFGHACLLVETDGARILIDPGVFSQGFESLNDLDAVVVTHQHPDHLDQDRLPALLAVNPGTRLLVDPQTHDLLSAKGIDCATLTAGEAVELKDVTLTPVGRLHAVIHDYVPRIDNVGVVVTAGGVRLYHPGDAYDGEPGDVDVLAVPLTAPWASVKETIAFVRRISARVAIPIHDMTASDAGRGMYVQHVSSFSGDDTTVHDLAVGEPWTVEPA